MRVVEAAELIAADVFKNADQTRQCITFGDVQRQPGPALQSSTGLQVWALWAGVAGDGATRLCDRLRVTATGQGEPGG